MLCHGAWRSPVLTTVPAAVDCPAEEQLFPSAALHVTRRDDLTMLEGEERFRWHRNAWHVLTHLRP